MKLFFSYPHDGNSPLIDQLRRDLGRDHDIWFDRDQIKPDDDWRRRIIHGLQDTGWSFAFLSPHAVKPGGVCRDEVAITLGETGWALTPVLVEAIPDKDFPVLPGHVQMHDLSAWRDQGDIGSPQFMAWYTPRLAALQAVLTDPRNAAYADEVATIKTRLAPPVAQDSEIARLTDGFVGREWLHDLVDGWRRDPDRARLLWLSANPGMGKSAFAAWLARMHRANVVALRLCSYASEDRNDPARVLRALAFQLARRLADYRHRLLATLPATADLLPANIDDLARLLLIAPLGPASAIDGGRAGDPFLVVVDGLDETVLGDASPLTRLLVALAADLPRWLGLMVTSRPDSPVREMLGGARTLLLEDHAADNDRDLAIYATAWLQARSPPPADLARAVARLVAAAQGSMTYLRALRAMNADAPTDIDGLPLGLGALYFKWFERQFPDRDTYLRARPVIDVLTAAHVPVPVAVLAEATGLSGFDTADRLRALGSLFGAQQSGIAPFHLSLREWLAGKPPADPGRFAADVAAGGGRLGDLLGTRLRAAGDGPLLDRFLLAEFPAQIGMMDAAARGGWLTAHGGAAALRGAIVATIGALRDGRAWPLVLAWCGAAQGLAEAGGDHWLGWWVTDEEGITNVLLGNTQVAMGMFQQAKKIAARRAEAEKDNPDAQRDLSVSFNRIGDVLVAQGKGDDALKAFRDGLAIAERLAKADPGNAGWQRDLSVSFEKIGDVLVAQGKGDDAIKAFRDGLAIAERLAKADPGNAGWQRDLFVSLWKITGILLDSGKRDAACVTAKRLETQAQLLADRFPEDRQRDDYLRDATDLVRRACGGG